MKKPYKIALLFIFFGAFTPITISIYNKSSEKRKEKEMISNLGDLELVTLENKEFKVSSLEIDNNILIYFFNSNCHLCKEDLKELYNQDYDNSNQVIAVSNENIEQIRVFKEENLKNKSVNNIKLVVDKTGKLFDRFNIKTTPQLFKYNSKKILIGHYKGAIDINKFYD
ncbi:MAG: redoxin domain-containing protein [Eudoraea sp.]|nr:redoxin domain-containing protein [Eudoraea sp.]